MAQTSYHGHISLKNGFGALGEYDGLSALPTKATRAGKSSQQVTWKSFFFKAARAGLAGV